MKNVRRLCVVLCSIVLAVLSPRAAFAQTSSGWQFDLSPLYFWAPSTSGNLAINGKSDIPVYMSFADAKDKLAGAFTFHGEARKQRFGFLGDVNFISLSSDVNYTTPLLSLPIAGHLELDQVLVNAKGMYEVKSGSRFYVVGGVRTMTISPNVHFNGPTGGQLADFEGSSTKVAGVAGVIFRPRINDRFTLLTQADIGGGSAFTWSAFGGIEFLVKPWIGLSGGYGALGIDTGNVPKSGSLPIGSAVGDTKYTVKQYGPAFAVSFHLN